MTLSNNEKEWNRVSNLGSYLSCFGSDNPHIYQLKTIIEYSNGIPSTNGMDTTRL